MVCKTCGAWMSDDAVVCTQCGAEAHEDNGQPEVAEKPKKTYKMGWYKFNIYFSLWAGGFLNIINGIKLLAGNAENAEAYAQYPVLRVLDILFALFCIALGAFLIYTRFQVAGFKKKAPKLLQLAYTAAAVGSIVYAMGASVALGVNVFNVSVYSSVIVNAVLMFINKVYFLKRRKLFDN